MSAMDSSESNALSQDGKRNGRLAVRTATSGDGPASAPRDAKKKDEAPARNDRASKTFVRAQHLAESNRLEEAIDLLSAQGDADPALANALGVCLMRNGRNADAVNVFRRLVLMPGCTWMRKDVPVAYKVNFATALALAGLLSGCYEILGEINAEENPHVRQLREAIAKWKADLSFWQRVKLVLNAQSGTPLTVSFPPGDFGSTADLQPPDNRRPG